ncbi:MAG: hypothetical protein KIT33_13630 [Candidatus Kapabacteria bacterium]|nr:hypothetical protein [Ignavibacteriota bacterium]MCW5886006.1 hypothetical protein [Candidatus Kapabacteria bacterium]
MISIWDASYIVTDVETTGSHNVKNRMTEIACVTVRNGNIMSSYSSLMNPYQQIPSYVARMTGISQAMVSVAPDESEIIDRVRSLFQIKNPVFVAHNVSFDYGFVGSFFKRGSISFDYPQLCTLKLARKLLPRDIKKNVGDLAAYFGVKLKNRHRALIDARATAHILIELLRIAESEHNISNLSELLQFQNKAVSYYKIPNSVSAKFQDVISEIPYFPGILNFYDKNGRIIYRDYAYNLNSKADSIINSYHFTSKKIFEGMSNLYRIDWQTADSELSTLIMREKFSSSGQNYSELFQDSEKEDYISKLPSDFIYVNYPEDRMNLADIYFVKGGKLIAIEGLGRMASTKPLAKLMSKIYSNGNLLLNEIDKYELTLIHKWIDMQNENGFIIDFRNTPKNDALEYMQVNLDKFYKIKQKNIAEDYNF